MSIFVAILGLILLRSQPNPQPLRQELFRLCLNNQKAYRACMDSLANQFTPGYRARDVLYATSHLGSKRFPLRMNQGQLQETRDPYNLAIDGSGFFLLNDGSLTRDGSWAPLSQQPKARGLQETELPPTTSQSVLMRVLSFAFPTHKEVQPLSQFQASITAPASASA